MTLMVMSTTMILFLLQGKSVYDDGESCCQWWWRWQLQWCFLWPLTFRRRVLQLWLIEGVEHGRRFRWRGFCFFYPKRWWWTWMKMVVFTLQDGGEGWQRIIGNEQDKNDRDNNLLFRRCSARSSPCSRPRSKRSSSSTNTLQVGSFDLLFKP